MDVIIKNSIPQIVTLCEKFKVRRLYAFGSVAKGFFSDKHSDIDLFVELMPLSAMERGEALMDLWDQLEIPESRRYRRSMWGLLVINYSNFAATISCIVTNHLYPILAQLPQTDRRRFSFSGAMNVVTRFLWRLMPGE